MKNTKRLCCLLLVMVMLCSLLAGCGSEKPKDSGTAEYEIVFAHGNSPDTPHHKAAEAFKQYVEEKSEGRISVSLFHSNQLGSAMECFEALQNGSMEVTFVPTARLSSYAPELQIFDLPFLFPDAETKFEIMDGDIGKQLLESLADKQVIPVGFYDDGDKQMTANKPLVTLDDFKGVKFRTMESPIIMEQYSALGASPVSIEYSDLYNSLQMKVADAQENPLMQIYTNSYYEVQDYLMMTNHASLSGVLLYSESWFNSLPEDLQQIMMDAGRLWIENERKGISESEATWLEEIKASGTEVIELTDEQISAFRTATEPVYDVYRNQFGSDILDQILEKVR